MKWNWQHKKWPHFNFNEASFIKLQQKFIEQAGEQTGSIKHISYDEKEVLKIQLLSNEAFKTSLIEGEILDRDSLQSSVQRQFGLKAADRKIRPEEQGISEMMVDLYHNFDKPLTNIHLFHWHSLLLCAKIGIESIGAYRTHSDPMQIVSGAYHNPKIHFEAPPSRIVANEMKQFIDWFNTTKLNTLGLVRAAIAHIYFESIHPFEDGNGRIGRAISEKALSQNLGRPTLIALSETIEKNKKGYYQALHNASTTLDINEWILFFCEIILKAQERSQSNIDFLIEKSKFYLKFAHRFNERQSKVIRSMFNQGIDGFKGGLSAENYISITGTSRATATRDLQNLVKFTALNKIGERRYTRYYLKINHPSAYIKLE
jgi:Fic family protein